MAKKRSKRLTTVSEEKILDLLRVRYPAPSYAFLWQVRNGTGWSRHQARTADALAMSLWPSRGLELIGFEIKSARSDWLAEMKHPEKAEEIARFCDRWYIVAGSADVLDKGELPPKWGLIVVKGKKLYTEVKAEKLDPVPLDMPMICAIFRKVTEIATPQAKLDSAYDRGHKAAMESNKAVEESRDKFRKQKIDHLEKQIREFEEASGVQIDGWDGAEKIGDAVRMVLNDEHTGLLNRLTRLRDQVNGILESTDRAIASVKPTPAESPK
jgi:hypothetical protein